MLRMVRYTPYVFTFTLLVAVLVTSFTLSRWSAHAEENSSTPDHTGAAPTNERAAPDNPAESAVYMPLIPNDYNARLSPRIGFGTSSLPVTSAGDVRALNAGWYVDWMVNSNLVRPAGMDYMPMVRVHQKLACPIGTTADRKKCPYLQEYEYSPSASEIEAFAKAHPGSTWLLGNEMDRVDWPNGGRQDEMQPTLYPKFYHELYTLIKAADPTAKVAIGGVIQATELRMKYLSKIWTTYQQLYGTDMPVDVWNVHNFINAEFCHYESGELTCYGGAVPPDSEVLEGAYYGQDWLHINRDVFAKQIRNMRQWMKERGQQQKPLIVTEYGVLYNDIACSKPGPNGTCLDPNWVDLGDPKVVHDFMLWTFDYFADTKDCNLGYAADDCRLVQRWAWFSLENVGWDFNKHGALFGADKQITEAGQLFRQYTTANYGKLQ